MAVLLLHDIIASADRVENGVDSTENTAFLAMAGPSGSTILALSQPVTVLRRYMLSQLITYVCCYSITGFISLDV
jgi:hypothetical protein